MKKNFLRFKSILIGSNEKPMSDFSRYVLFSSFEFIIIKFVMSSSEEYWIISVPSKSSPRQSYDEVCQATGRDQLSINYLLNIPDLKVKSSSKEDFSRIFI